MKISEEEIRKNAEGYNFIAGIDEAGRGPLAGPVVAAAVVLPLDFEIPALNDSKKLTPKKREKVYQEIISCAETYGIGIVSHNVIDKINIYRASLLAMKKAVMNLGFTPEYLLVDGFTIPDIKIPQKGIKKGDEKCCCIAAASVIAKVTRDRIMQELDRVYPQYGFAKHKGYPTYFHLQAIKNFGPSPFHRRSFRPLKELIYKKSKLL